MNVWLSDTNTVSAIFPSYLLRAFQMTPKFTNDIRQANVIIGGRHVTKIPENFQGTLIGVGLDRACMRTLPLTKIVNLLGRKTAECLLGGSDGGGGSTPMIMGDPLLLADFVWQRLMVGSVSATPPASPPALTIILRNENERKYVIPHLETSETQIVVGLGGTDSLLDFFALIRSAKAIVTSDPDTMAVALSFNVPCAGMSFGSADLFVWKDLFSVLANNGRDLVIKRLKPVTTVQEILKSWVKTQPFGELKVLKANLLHQFEGFFQRKAAPAPTKPQIILRKVAATPATPGSLLAPGSSSSSLSQTQPIIPMKRLNPTWVVAAAPGPPAPPPLPSLVLPVLPPQPNSARSRASSRVNSARSSSSHTRSKSLMKKPRKKNIISHDTPKSM